MENITIAELLESKHDADDSLCEIVLQVIKVRKSKGMSQQDLASQAGIDVRDLMFLESFAFEMISIVVLSKVLFSLGLKVKVEN